MFALNKLTLNRKKVTHYNDSILKIITGFRKYIISQCSADNVMCNESLKLIDAFSFQFFFL